MLVNICNFLIYFVEAVIIWQYASSLFLSKNQSSAPSLITLSVLYLSAYAISLLGVNWLNLISYFIINLIFLFTQYQIKLYIAFFHSVILTSVMGISELAVYSIIERFSPHFFVDATNAHSIILFAVLSKLTFYTIIYLIIHIQKGAKKAEQQYDKSVFLLIFIPVTSLFVLQTFVNISDSLIISQNLKHMITISAFLLMLSNLLILGISDHNQRKNMQFTEMQLLLQKEYDLARYYEMLHTQNENQRILIHDIKKHLNTIDVLNAQGEQDKISAYIRQLNLSSDLKEFANLCDNKVLNTILSRYMQQCFDKHIDFQVDARSGILNFISDTDMSALFCNVLDNAVEAAEIIPNSYIELNAVKRPNTPFVVITAINSCRKSPFSPSDKTLLRTHKKDSAQHGFGIKSIKRVVNKYHGDIQMYYNEESATFHTIITLRKEESL